MKITWLGQAGFLFETHGLKIIIDPYLSSSCHKLNPNNFRRMPIDEKYLSIRPDVIVLTHNHMDHVDPETLVHYLNKDTGVLVLAPQAAWEEVRKFGHNHNYVKFNRHTEWVEKGVKFTAVKAEHSDVHPIGVIIEAEGKKYYITGDTLYNSEIFEDIPDDIYALFVVMNGKGNNMNQYDAERFAEKVNAKITVPTHWGLHDELHPVDFKYKKVVMPEIYKEVILED